MSRRYSSLIRCSLFLLLVSLTRPAFGDGVSTVTFGGSRAAEIAQQGGQAAFIDWKDGHEKLFISIAVKNREQAKGLVWIVPIPAKPSDVQLGVEKEIPERKGKNIRSTAIFKVLQIGKLALWFNAPAGLANFLETEILPPGGERSLDIHQSIIEKGITIELVTSSEDGELGKYLRDSGIKLPDEVSKKMDVYRGEGACFAIAHITDFEEFVKTGRKDIPEWTKRSQNEKDWFYSLAMRLEFPSAKPYYPMRLTSAYGDQRVKVELAVRGLYKLDQNPGNNKYFGSEHFIAKGLETESMEPFTRISSTFNAFDLTEDWVFSNAPRKIHFQSWLALASSAQIIFLYLGFVAISLAITNSLFFPKSLMNPPLWIKTLALGLVPLVGSFLIIWCHYPERKRQAPFFTKVKVILTFLLLPVLLFGSFYLVFVQLALFLNEPFNLFTRFAAELLFFCPPAYLVVWFLLSKLKPAPIDPASKWSWLDPQNSMDAFEHSFILLFTELVLGTTFFSVVFW